MISPSANVENSPPPDSAGKTDERSSRREFRLLLIGIGLALAACVYMVVRNGQASAKLENRITQSIALMQDVRMIRTLRDVPQGDAARVNPSTDILDSVNAAMQSSGLDAKSLVSTQPQAARPIPGTDVSDVEYRLIFNDLPLDSFARFAQACQTGTQQFRTAGVVLRAAPENHWNVDLLLSIREQSQAP